MIKRAAAGLTPVEVFPLSRRPCAGLQFISLFIHDDITDPVVYQYRDIEIGDGRVYAKDFTKVLNKGRGKEFLGLFPGFPELYGVAVTSCLVVTELFAHQTGKALENTVGSPDEFFRNRPARRFTGKVVGNQNSFHNSSLY